MCPFSLRINNKRVQKISRDYLKVDLKFYEILLDQDSDEIGPSAVERPRRTTPEPAVFGALFTRTRCYSVLADLKVPEPKETFYLNPQPRHSSLSPPTWILNLHCDYSSVSVRRHCFLRSHHRATSPRLPTGDSNPPYGRIIQISCAQERRQSSDIPVCAGISPNTSRFEPGGRADRSIAWRRYRYNSGDGELSVQVVRLLALLDSRKFVGNTGFAA